MDRCPASSAASRAGSRARAPLRGSGRARRAAYAAFSKVRLARLFTAAGSIRVAAEVATPCRRSGRDSSDAARSSRRSRPRSTACAAPRPLAGDQRRARDRQDAAARRARRARRRAPAPGVRGPRRRARARAAVRDLDRRARRPRRLARRAQARGADRRARRRARARAAVGRRRRAAGGLQDERFHAYRAVRALLQRMAMGHPRRAHARRRPLGGRRLARADRPPAAPPAAGARS